MNPNDLKRLTYFAEVVQSGSFAGAARALSLPRSSVSEHIRLLEASLGVRLLQRTTRKLSLTPEGQEVYARAQSIQELVGEINSLSGNQHASGTITVSATQDIADVWLLPKLTEFNQAYPDIQVNLMADDYLSDLVEQRIDVAVRVSVKGRDSNLVGRTLGEEALRLFASPAYVKRHDVPISPKALTEWDWILLQQTTTDGKVKLHKGKRNYELKPLLSRTTNAPTLQRRLLEQGHGIGLHLPSLITQQLDAGILVPVMPNVSSTVYSIQLVYPSRKLPLRTRAFVEFLVDSGWQ